MPKYTQETFIEKCKNIHNNYYDYSLIEYEKTNKKIKIICPLHGIFEQMARNHSYGAGCQKCGRASASKKQALTNEIFIEKANKIHNNLYDYSLINYVNGRTKIEIICSKHGVFLQSPESHLAGYCGCIYCAKNLTPEEFFKKCDEVHNREYDYSESVYQGINHKVTVKCIKHGFFTQIASNHLYHKSKCSKCRYENLPQNKPYTQEQFISKCLEIHGEEFDYSLTKYINSYTKLDIICNIHGPFSILPTNHTSNKQGCPSCKSSKGEKLIRKILTEHKINFTEQKKFNNCINPITKYSLMFDFYITDLNTAIEYDGRHHFQAVKLWGGENYLNYIQYKDEIKNEYCLKNNINLLRIKHNEDILSKLIEYKII